MILESRRLTLPKPSPCPRRTENWQFTPAYSSGGKCVRGKCLVVFRLTGKAPQRRWPHAGLLSSGLLARLTPSSATPRRSTPSSGFLARCAATGNGAHGGAHAAEVHGHVSQAGRAALLDFEFGEPAPGNGGITALMVMLPRCAGW
jgi:hypothetical protein